ncbi:polygalacturonase-like [Carica papaya]|uniref:Ripening-induced polygalacturonase n=1 Tax=Carica papaya TaxID=3649 RepID=B5TQZ7_CARPA|nr:polygalacturonase-like [Carica papaya]ACH82233.1 ripening-induced polygalacturonase [Carica papaya]ACH82234.1 ripening-induced polygalacturonase [Carica papaya]
MTTIRSHNLLLLLLPLLLLSSSATPSSATSTHNVVAYGAKPGGTTDSRQAFLSAWKNACASARPATLYVPRGKFLLAGRIVFDGECRNSKMVVRIDGTLVAPADYRVLKDGGYWVLFQNVNGLSVYGGVLDGRGSGLWDCKKAGHSCPFGATSIGFLNSRNIVIDGLTSLNSQVFHIVIYGCNNVKLQGTKVSASGVSPNTDGIHVQMSSHVTILSSTIATGDDCVSIGPGTSTLWIENMACGPGHGISVGSLGKYSNEPGVQNVTVKSVSFTGTQNGARIKSWGRPSNGFAKNIIFQHVTMNNVQNPIVIDQNYCPGNVRCPGKISGIKVSDVTYEDIHGSSATEVAVNFDCSPERPCTGIKLRNVRLSYKNQKAEASCKHAGGTVSGTVQPNSCL